MLASLFLILGLSFLSFLALISFYLRRLQKKISNLSIQSDSHINQFDQIELSSKSLGQRILSIEDAVQNLIERQNKIENQEPQSASYTQAAKLLEMGANVDELKSTCGLGRAESEFMMTMHQKDLEEKIYHSV